MARKARPARDKESRVTWKPTKPTKPTQNKTWVPLQTTQNRRAEKGEPSPFVPNSRNHCGIPTDTKVLLLRINSKGGTRQGQAVNMLRLDAPSFELTWFPFQGEGACSVNQLETPKTSRSSSVRNLQLRHCFNVFFWGGFQPGFQGKPNSRSSS